MAWRRALAQVRVAVRRQAQAEERVRLARNLHDDLGARLTRISVLTEVIHRDGSGSEPVRQSALLLGQTAREILDTMSPSVWSVDPANDTLESLVSFVLTHAASFFEGSEITLQTEAPVAMPERTVPANQRRNIFLAVKEALNNVAKHSGATEVNLRITFTEPVLTIVVEDNGKGLPAGPAKEFGNGLKNMLQRMIEAGGNFTVETRAEGGVRVKLVARI